MPLQKYKGIQRFSNVPRIKVGNLRNCFLMSAASKVANLQTFTIIQNAIIKVGNLQATYIAWISLTSTLAPTERPGHPFASSVASSSEPAFTIV